MGHDIMQLPRDALPFPRHGQLRIRLHPIGALQTVPHDQAERERHCQQHPREDRVVDPAGGYQQEQRVIIATSLTLLSRRTSVERAEPRATIVNVEAG